MNYTKIVSFVAGFSILAATLAPVKVSAASAAMSLSGATQTNGNFSTLVYENADGPVSSVKLALSFNAAVSNVNYDYSVGPFTTVDPDGYHLAQGAESGSRLVAKVSFTLANPGTVTAAVDPSGTSIKGTSADKKSLVVYSVGSASANFTYNAPAVGGQGGGSTGGSQGNNGGTSGSSSNGGQMATTGSTGATTPAVSTSATPEANSTAGDNKAETKAETTKDESKAGSEAAKDGENKSADAANTSNKRNWWPMIIILLVAAAAAVYAYRNRGVAAPAEKEVATTKASKKPAPAATEAVAVAPVAAKLKDAENKTGAKAKNNAKRAGNRAGNRRPSNKRSR